MKKVLSTADQIAEYISIYGILIQIPINVILIFIDLTLQANHSRFYHPFEHMTTPYGNFLFKVDIPLVIGFIYYTGKWVKEEEDRLHRLNNVGKLGIGHLPPSKTPETVNKEWKVLPS